MKHIDTYILERFVLNTSAFSPEMLSEIQTHLAVCEDCQREYETILIFYKEVEQLNNEGVSPEAIKLTRRITKSEEQRIAQIIPLFPEQKIKQMQSFPHSVLALAAQQTDLKLRYIPVATLTSTDEQVILRFIQNSDTGTYILQIHSDDRNAYEHVIVTFDALPGEFVSDKNGRVQLDTINVEDVNELHAFIHKVEIQCTIEESMFNNLETNNECTLFFDDDINIQCTLYADKQFVNIRINSSHSFTSLLLVDGDKTHHYRLDESGASIPRNVFNANAICKFFY